mgnify:CR=1 FL=1
MVDADRIIRGVMKREGWPEYTDHLHDRGGPTKGGITLRTLESWRRNRCRVEELQALTETEAIAIYRRRYVEMNGISQIDDYDLLEQTVDNAVLSGPFLAVRDLQRAVSVDDDGIIGPITLLAISACGADAASIRLCKMRSLRLAGHVAKNPGQLVFLVGWLNRSLSFLP